MAFLRGTNAKLLIDQYDFSGSTNMISVSMEVANLDPTTLASTGVEKFPGLPSGGIEHNGFMTGGTANEIFDALRDRLAIANTATVAVTFGTTGIAAVILPTTYNGQLKLDAPAQDLITIAGNWPSNGQLLNGILIARATISGTGNQTSIDFGAAGAAGGFAYLFVKTITGSATDAIIKVRSASTQGGSYSDEGTFTFSATGVYTATLSGTVNRWLQINTEDLGGATSFAVDCIVGLAGINYSVA
jgi:hypothetical protein